MNKQYPIPIASAPGAGGGGGTLPTGSGNEVIATPADGSSGVSALRSLVAADIPQSVIALPTAGFASPSPAYAHPEASADENPSIYVQDVNGDWHQQAYVDTVTPGSAAGSGGNGPLTPNGTITFCRRTWFRDVSGTTSTQAFKNSFVSISHGASIGTSNANQDRALSVFMYNAKGTITSFAIDNNNVVTFNMTGAAYWQYGMVAAANGLSVGTYLNGVSLVIQTVTNSGNTVTASASGFTHAQVNQTSDAGFLDQVMHSMEGIQVELDLNGNSPTLNGSPDGECSAVSVQASCAATGNISNPSFGFNGIRVSTTRPGGALGLSFTGINVNATNSSNVGAPALSFIGINVGPVQDVNGGAFVPSPSTGYGIAINAPAGAHRFLTNNYGLYIHDYGSTAGDYAIYVAGGNSRFDTSIFNAVPSLPSQSQNQFLASADGSSSVPAFRVLAVNDYPTMVGDSGLGGTKGAVPAPGSGDAAASKFLKADGTWQTPSVPASSVSWDNITAAAGNLTLLNGTNATEFDQTSAVTWAWKNTTSAVHLTSQSSPIWKLSGTVFTGAVSAEDSWTIQNIVGNTDNGISQLRLVHAGSTGAASLNIPAGSTTAPSLTFGTAVNSGGTFGGGFLSEAASVLAIHPGDGTGNVAPLLDWYRNNNNVATRSARIGVASSISGGFQILCEENNANLQQIVLASSQSTTAGAGIQLGGDGGNNGKVPSQISGNSTGIRIGNGSSSGPGAVAFIPVYGTGTFQSLWLNPVTNQALITGNIAGVEVSSNVVTIVFNATLATGFTSAATNDVVTAVTNTSVNGTPASLTANQNRATATITNSAEAAVTNIVTLSMSDTKSMATNDYCYLIGLTVATWLNGKVVKLTGVVSNTSVTFVDPTGHGLSASQADTGTIVASYIKYSKTTGNIALTSDTGTVTQQATGAVTDILLNSVETAVGGTHNLLDLQAGSAGTTSEFAVNNVGKITTYNSVTTAGQGVASEIYQTLNPTLSANFNAGSAVTMFTPTVAKAYRISACMGANVAATAGTMPSLTVGWTDAGGIARTFILLASTVTSATSDYVQGSLRIYTDNSTAVTITSASYAAGSGTALTYSLAVTAEAL